MASAVNDIQALDTQLSADERVQLIKQSPRRCPD